MSDDADLDDGLLLEGLLADCDDGGDAGADPAAVIPEAAHASPANMVLSQHPSRGQPSIRPTAHDATPRRPVAATSGLAVIAGSGDEATGAGGGLPFAAGAVVKEPHSGIRLQPLPQRSAQLFLRDEWDIATRQHPFHAIAALQSRRDQASPAATAGVVIAKHYPKSCGSSGGSGGGDGGGGASYGIVKLWSLRGSSLTGGVHATNAEVMSIVLGGLSFAQHFARLSVGDVVLVVNPSVSDSKKGNNSSGAGVAPLPSLPLYRCREPSSVVVVGRSVDLGTCAGMGHKTGHHNGPAQPCTVPINRAAGAFCKFHAGGSAAKELREAKAALAGTYGAASPGAARDAVARGGVVTTALTHKTSLMMGGAAGGGLHGASSSVLLRPGVGSARRGSAATTAAGPAALGVDAFRLRSEMEAQLFRIAGAGAGATPSPCVPDEAPIAAGRLAGLGTAGVTAQMLHTIGPADGQLSPRGRWRAQGCTIEAEAAGRASNNSSQSITASNNSSQSLAASNTTSAMSTQGFVCIRGGRMVATADKPPAPDRLSQSLTAHRANTTTPLGPTPLAEPDAAGASGGVGSGGPGAARGRAVLVAARLQQEAIAQRADLDAARHLALKRARDGTAVTAAEGPSPAAAHAVSHAMQAARTIAAEAHGSYSSGMMTRRTQQQQLQALRSVPTTPTYAPLVGSLGGSGSGANSAAVLCVAGEETAMAKFQRLAGGRAQQTPGERRAAEARAGLAGLAAAGGGGFVQKALQQADVMSRAAAVGSRHETALQGADRDAQMATLDKIVRVEEALQKLEAVREVPNVPCVRCHTCNSLQPAGMDTCRLGGHATEKAVATRRFYECRACGRCRVTNLEDPAAGPIAASCQLSQRQCPKCRAVGLWERCGSAPVAPGAPPRDTGPAPIMD